MISVCMASYNGSRYIHAQIQSILPQLSAEDELVVVDDGSSDDTISILEGFADTRIRVHRNERNIGVIKTFERALRHSSGDIVFLCDQDDLWRSEKVHRFKELFAADPSLTLALSDAEIIDAEGHILSGSAHAIRRAKPGLVTNIVKNTFLGCTMVLRRRLLDFCLPFPANVPMHDMWIGLISEMYGKTAFIHEPLVLYRRHGQNATGDRHASIPQMLRWRIDLVRGLAMRWLHVKKTATGMGATSIE